MTVLCFKGKKEEGRRKKEEGRRKKEEGRRKIIPSSNLKLKIPNSNLKTIPHIVSGCIGIIKLSQQLTLNHSVFQSRVNSQQSTVNSQQSFLSATGIDIISFP
ncbi:MAG: hypothetical protein WBA89_28215, partial [Microcoleus sp.]